MKESRPSKRHESAFTLSNSHAMAANIVSGWSGRPLVLLLTRLVSAVAVMPAQTAGSRAAEVHDHLRKAAEYLQAKDPNSAVKEFGAVLALDPNNAEAYANLGVIAFFQRDYQKASQYFRKALAIDPSLAKPQALLGISQKRLGDPSAPALLEKSFQKLKDKQLRLQVGMELAALYDQQGDPGATACVMRSLVDLDPDNVEVLFMAERVYSELADGTLNKLAVLAPGSARMQQVIAERLVNDGDLKGAIDHYRKALRIDPQVRVVNFEWGEAILESATGNAATETEAEKELALAVRVDGDTAKTECEFGRLALPQGRPDEALAFYQRADRLDPNEVQAQMGLAKLLLPENPQAAIKYLRMAVQSDPLNSAAHYRLAQAYNHLQMTELANQELRLFQEIKKTKDQVETLYHEMNRQPKPETDAVQDN